MSHVEEEEPEFSDREWILSKLLPPDSNGCRLWTGGVHKKDGSGQQWFRGRPVKARRLVYEIAVGPVPPESVVSHRTEPYSAPKLCCTPDHLELITPQENSSRASKLNRRLPRPAAKEQKPDFSCFRGHDSVPENVCYDRHGRQRCRPCAQSQGYPWRDRLTPPQEV